MKFFIKKYYIGFEDEYLDMDICSSENLDEVINTMAGKGVIMSYEEKLRTVINQGEDVTIEISLSNPKKIR